eukprot:m.43141 g.43141  ORF g.43141 m.43141 type:complete len:168 (+) comp10739_c0_seq4:3-506(+)
MDDILRPPENFAMVCSGIFRSGFPAEKNLGFLKTLNLRAVLPLVPEELPDILLSFYKENNIAVLQVGVPGNKEPFVDIPDDKIAEALEKLLDARNHPVLIHCNKGKHRTGCLVGCLRKVQKWSHASICDEYHRYAQPKARALDQQFIELFDISAVRVLPPHRPAWLL